jgi:hypothetical protein
VLGGCVDQADRPGRVHPCMLVVATCGSHTFSSSAFQFFSLPSAPNVEATQRIRLVSFSFLFFSFSFSFHVLQICKLFRLAFSGNFAQALF